MPSLGDLVVNLRANTSQFANGMTDGQRRMVAFRKVAVGAFAAVSASLLSVAAIFKTKVLPQFAELDEVAKLSQNTGFQTEELLAYGFAAEQTGVASSSLNSGLQKLQRTIGDARAGSASAQSALGALGVTLADLESNTPAQTLDQIADGFSGMTNEADQAAAANRIFGRSGVELLNFLKQGSSGLADFRAEAEGLGILFSSSDLANIEAANDAMNRLDRTIESMWQKMAVEAAPAVEKLADELTGLANNEQQMRDIVGVAGDLADVLVEVAKAAGWMASAFKKSQSGWSVIIAGAGEFVGLAPEGTVDSLTDELNSRFAAVTRKAGNAPSDSLPELPEIPPITGFAAGHVGALGALAGITASATKDAEKWAAQMREQQKVHETMSQRAAQILASNETPDEAFAKAMEELGDLVIGGFLSEAVADREIAKLRQQYQQDEEVDRGQVGGLSGGAQAGSAEAFSMIAAAINQSRGATKDAQVKAADKTTAAVQKVEEAVKVGTFAFASGPKTVEDI